MNIVFSTMVYLPHIGGIETYIHTLAQYLIKNGNNVTVIVADRSCQSITENIIEGERIIRIPAYEIGAIAIVKRNKYLRIIESEISKADVVHVNVCKFLYRYFARMKAKYHYRLITTSHGWIFHTTKYKRIKQLYFKHIVAKYASLYDKIINVSFQDQDIAMKYGIRDSIVIMNGVDCEKYADLGIKESFTDRFMYWGRIAPNKGIYECLVQFASYNRNFEFNIIGTCEDEEYWNKLNELIRKNDMEKNIIFLGNLSDSEIRCQLKETDIIMMPSLHEGFGMTLVECLKSNRPIIANTNESYKYILEKVGALEYLYDYNNSENKLSEKVEALLNKEVSPINVDQFSSANMIMKTLECYDY